MPTNPPDPHPPHFLLEPPARPGCLDLSAPPPQPATPPRPDRAAIIARCSREFGPPHQRRTITRWRLPAAARHTDTLSIVLGEPRLDGCCRLWLFEPVGRGLVPHTFDLVDHAHLDAAVASIHDLAARLRSEGAIP